MALTHDELCQIAYQFLKRNGFKVCFHDRFVVVTSTGEQPDAMGFRNFASCLIEAKCSRADMLQELQKSAGVSNNCRSNEKLQDQHVESLTTIKAAPALDSLPKNAESRSGNSLANDTNVVKRLTITMPDTSSKAFWSGTGKTETFHPVTYRRWVKEAIERYCAIARIDVEVK